MSGAQEFRIAIVGTGFAGLGMAIRLKQAGIEDFVVLERADDVGGTWRDNTYPGCACDVPSHLYSFSFAANPAWTRTFSPQSEIWAYLRRCADEFGVRPHIRFGHEVTDAAWDEHARCWHVQTSGGSVRARVLVPAMGALSEPSLPAIPGLETFAGTAFHSARWDHDHDLGGRRVAMIGTGASTIQVLPRIQPEVERLLLFQRTPPWVMPHPDRRLTHTERRIYRALPAAQALMRSGIYWARELFVLPFRHRRLAGLPQCLALRHLRRQVRDPRLRERLTPDYEIGCKRILISNHYYPALQRPNVDLVTDAIAEVRPHAIVTADGVEHEVDTIVFGTGFRVTDMPAAQRIRGRDGRRLADVWQGSPRAYLGTTITGFPNLFMLVGPNTGLGHSSMVFMIESQIRYVLDALRLMDERRAVAVDVRPEVQRAFNEGVEEDMRATVWTAGGCASWYLDARGRNTTLWPGFTWRFRRRTATFDAASYTLETGALTASS